MQRKLLLQQQQQQNQLRQPQHYQYQQQQQQQYVNESQPHWRLNAQNAEYHPQHAQHVNYGQYRYGGSTSATASPNLGPRKHFTNLEMDNHYVRLQGNTSPIGKFKQNEFHSLETN